MKIGRMLAYVSATVNNMQGDINQTSILSQITIVVTMDSANRIKDGYKTMDGRIGYLKSL